MLIFRGNDVFIWSKKFLCPPLAQLVRARSLYLRGPWFESKGADRKIFPYTPGPWFESKGADKYFTILGRVIFILGGKLPGLKPGQYLLIIISSKNEYFKKA